MSSDPQLQERAAQHYAAIPMTVTMDSISRAVDSGFPELFGWLASNDIAMSGPPFIRYLVIDMAGELQIEQLEGAQLALSQEAQELGGRFHGERIGAHCAQCGCLWVKYKAGNCARKALAGR